MPNLDDPLKDNLVEAQLPEQLEAELRRMGYISIEQLYMLMTSNIQHVYRAWFKKLGADFDQILDRLQKIIPQQTLLLINSTTTPSPSGAKPH